jgi:transcriptional regulator with XRE-family HTH domain
VRVLTWREGQAGKPLSQKVFQRSEVAMTNPENTVEQFLTQLKAYTLFAEMLEHYLCKQQVVAAHLAERIHVEAATVSNWRKNKRLPDNLGLIHQITIALNLSPLERENLVIAWCNTRMVRDLVPYLEAAAQSGDAEQAMRLIKRILGVSRFPFGNSTTDLGKE